jgi:hypothetical protein
MRRVQRRCFLGAIVILASLIAPATTATAATNTAVVSVFPRPGSTTASPATMISFRGISPGAIGSSNGYWLLGRDGGVFTFGNAKFRGSAAPGGGVALLHN